MQLFSSAAEALRDARHELDELCDRDKKLQKAGDPVATTRVEEAEHKVIQARRKASKLANHATQQTGERDSTDSVDERAHVKPRAQRWGNLGGHGASTSHMETCSMLQLKDFFNEGICAQTDPEVFFPPKRARNPKEAIAVCQKCPVLDQCREWALNQPWEQLYGVWGGLTHGQRRTAKTARRKETRKITL